ncbi:SDR family oxidoreductase [Candidatus Zixiibacteriota bacterium]
MDKPLVVFGATGLLGSHLVHRLAERGRFPVAVAHNRKVELPSGVPVYKASIAGAETVRKALSRYHPSLVINCAAYTDVDGCESDPQRARQVNTVGAENIARAAAELGIPLVHISTDYIFGGHSGPYDEHARPRPINVYGQSKHDAETAIQKINADTLIIRAASFIGHGSEKHPCFIENMIAGLRAGKPLPAPIDLIANVAEVPTLADAIIAAIDKSITGVLHLGSRELISRYDLAVLTADVFGLDDSLIEPVMYADLGRAAERPLNGGLVVDGAEKLLEISFPAPKETLENLKRVSAAE